MKFAAKGLLLVPLAATFAFAQTLPHFKHIIIVVQENRTPDNLFGAGGASKGATCGSPNPFMPGVDIDNGGANNAPGVPNPTCNMQLPLNGWDSEQYQDSKGNWHTIGIVDPDHTYAPGFVADYDYYDNKGHQDGFCHQYVYSATHPCPYYSYAAASDVQPYFFIAQKYGFGNYTCSKPGKAPATRRTSFSLPEPQRRWRPVKTTTWATIWTSWPTTRASDANAPARVLTGFIPMAPN